MHWLWFGCPPCPSGQGLPAGAANTAGGAGDRGGVVVPGVSPKGLLGIAIPTGLGL